MKPSELGDAALAEIAFVVRTRLEQKFGKDKTTKFISDNLEMVTEVAKATWVATRAFMEKHDAKP